MAPVRMKIAALALDKNTKSPFVMLRDEAGMRSLPIYIGLMEANAIAMEIEKMRFPRPMTHDLLATTIRSLGARLERICVTELRQGTYFANLYLLREGETLEVDSRPSDAIALALRLDAPIFVDESVLAVAATDTSEADSAERQRWKEFLENLSDEDFGKYKM